VPIAAATVILIGVFFTITQKDRADRRDQWWKRVQWSAELLITTSDHSRAIGMAALLAIISQQARVEDGDAALLQAIIDQVSLEPFNEPASEPV
jgi:hypothetical protein